MPDLTPGDVDLVERSLSECLELLDRLDLDKLVPYVSLALERLQEAYRLPR